MFGYVSKTMGRVLRNIDPVKIVTGVINISGGYSSFYGTNIYQTDSNKLTDVAAAFYGCDDSDPLKLPEVFSGSESSLSDFPE